MTREVARVMRSVFERLQEHERRLAGSQWTGKVTEVDGEKHLIRMAIGKDDDGNDVLSPWLPISQPAGALKLHSMPSAGQTMSVRSQSGDIEQGVAQPYFWSDDNQAPSTNPNEHKLTLGSVTITLTGQGLTLQVGGTVLNVTASGLTIDAESIAANGSTFTHNDLNIGHDHKHQGVEPGGGQSGPPTG